VVVVVVVVVLVVVVVVLTRLMFGMPPGRVSDMGGATASFFSRSTASKASLIARACAADSSPGVILGSLKRASPTCDRWTARYRRWSRTPGGCGRIP
jgi:hypothetical protein